MRESFPDNSAEKREKKKEADFNKVERLKENLMKLEKSVVDVVDEGTQSARGAIQAMGFGITPVTDDDDEDAGDDVMRQRGKERAPRGSSVLAIGSALSTTVLKRMCF